jgi:hypothetical protein
MIQDGVLGGVFATLKTQTIMAYLRHDEDERMSLKTKPHSACSESVLGVVAGPS